MICAGLRLHLHPLRVEVHLQRRMCRCLLSTGRALMRYEPRDQGRGSEIAPGL